MVFYQTKSTLIFFQPSKMLRFRSYGSTLRVEYSTTSSFVLKCLILNFREFSTQVPRPRGVSRNGSRLCLHSWVATWRRLERQVVSETRSGAKQGAALEHHHCSRRSHWPKLPTHNSNDGQRCEWKIPITMLFYFVKPILWKFPVDSRTT